MDKVDFSGAEANNKMLKAMDKKLEDYAVDRSYINSQMFGIEHQLLNNIESAHVDPYEDSHVDIIRDKVFIPRQPIGGDYRLEEKRLRKALVCLSKAYSVNSDKCLLLRKKLHSFYLATNQVGMAHELVNCPSIHIYKLEHIYGKDEDTSETNAVGDRTSTKNKNDFKIYKKNMSPYKVKMQRDAFKASLSAPTPLKQMFGETLTTLRTYPSYKEYNAIIKLEGPTSIVMGDALHVNFSVSFPEQKEQYPHPLDTIALGPVHGDGLYQKNSIKSDEMVSAIKVPARSRHGKICFEGELALKDAGEYQAVYMFRGKYPFQSSSYRFKVSLIDAVVEPLRHDVRVGSTIGVKWKIAYYEQGTGNVDWIGLYYIGREDSSESQNVEKLVSRKDLPEFPVQEGFLQYFIPGIVGNFQLRYHVGKFDDQVIAKSKIIRGRMRIHSIAGRLVPLTEVRIILVSTYNDCFFERKYFKSIVVPHLEEVASLKSISFSYLDFTERGHKDQQKLPITSEGLLETLKYSLREAACCDYFVFLLGNRYGLVPDKSIVSNRFKAIHPWISEELNHSRSKSLKAKAGGSELEFLAHQAFFSNLKENGAADHCLFYFRSPAIVSNEPFSSLELQGFDNEIAVQDLKSRIIKQNANWVVYDNAKHFSNLVMRDLSQRFKSIAASSEDLIGPPSIVNFRRAYTNRKHKCSFAEMAVFQKDVQRRYNPHLSDLRLVVVDNVLGSSSAKFSDSILIDAWIIHLNSGSQYFVSDDKKSELELMTKELLGKLIAEKKQDSRLDDTAAWQSLDEYLNHEVKVDDIDNKNIPFIILGHSGTGKSAFLIQWLQHLRENGQEIADDQKNNNLSPMISFVLPICKPGSTTIIKTHIVCLHIGECPTAFINVSDILRFIAYEIAAQIGGCLKALEHFVRQANKDLIEHFPDFLQEMSERERILLVLDGVNRIEPFDFSWLKTSLPENVRVVLSISLSVQEDPLKCKYLKMLKSKDWLRSGRLILFKRIKSSDVLMMVRNFVNITEDTTVPDKVAALQGPGAIAVSSIYAEMLSESHDGSTIEKMQMEISKIWLLRNLRALRLFLASIEPWDSLSDFKGQIKTFSTCRSLSEMYDTFIDTIKTYKKGIKALQSILLSGNGLSETETRTLVDERNTTVWAKFIFQIEPHLICRRGSFLHLANLDAAAAVMRSFADEVERGEVYTHLINFWESRTHIDAIANRCTDELGYLYFTGWYGKPRLTQELSFDRGQKFMKFRIAARKKMWQFLTNYVSFKKNYRHSIRRHRLLEFFNILPPLKGEIWQNGLTVLLDSYLKNFKISAKFFHNGPFQGFLITEVSDACKNTNIFSMPHAYDIAYGLCMISKWLDDMRAPMFVNTWCYPTRQTSKSVYGLCLDSRRRVFSSCIFPNENLFFLERSFVILLGKGSFQALLNQIESIVQTRIFRKKSGRPYSTFSPLSLLAEIIESATAIYYKELLACAKILLKCEHRLPVDSFPPDMPDREEKLLFYVSRMTYTCLINNETAQIKNIVTKTKFKCLVMQKLNNSAQKTIESKTYKVFEKDRESFTNIVSQLKAVQKRCEKMDLLST